MIADKICYVHLRPSFNANNSSPTGGATFAWYVDEDNGNVFVGKPARCKMTTGKDLGDNFVKATGRELALQKLKTVDPLFVITRAEYMSNLLVNIESIFQLPGLSPQGNAALANSLKRMLVVDPIGMMSSTVFEQMVRGSLQLTNDNRAFYKTPLMEKEVEIR